MELFKKRKDKKRKNSRLYSERKKDYEIVDKKQNEKSKPPQKEDIRIPAMWVFEVFTPSNINNLYNGLKILGYQEKLLFGTMDINSLLDSYRYSIRQSGWINLGYLIDEKEKKMIGSNFKRKKLPEGIKEIKLSLMQSLPSTTILACQVRLNELKTKSLQEPVKKNYTTYEEKINRGYRIHDALSQKINAVNRTKYNLKKSAVSFIYENFPGLFSEELNIEDFPSVNLITFQETNLHEKIKNHKHGDFISVIGIEPEYFAYENKKLPGLILQFPEFKNAGNNIILYGNINSINIDLDGYGHTSKEANLVEYLAHLDKSLSIWILLVTIKLIEKKLTKLRDLFGKANLDDLNKSFSDLLKLDSHILQIQKDFIPLLYEIIETHNEDRSVDYELSDFKQINQRFKSNLNLFNRIKNRLRTHSELLINNVELLNRISETNRNIVTTKSSYYLAKTNINLQRGIYWMTGVLLFFTLVTILIRLDEKYNLLAIIEKLGKFINGII